MAEFVEKRIEETIPEIEEMERIGLLSVNEIKSLVQKRREFEYRIARRCKRKEDFLGYVEYETKLLELLKIRREKLGISAKRNVIEKAIKLRQVKKLRFMTRLWPSNRYLWQERIKFASLTGWTEEVSVAYAEQVRYLGNMESVWLSWAQWEIEGRNNFDQARKILLSKAPLYHPNSRLLRRELFRLELLYLEFLWNKIEADNLAGLEEIEAGNRDQVMQCSVARIVYEDMVNKFKEPSTYLELYLIANKFTFAEKLREDIFRDLCECFPNSVSIWKVKVQREILVISEKDPEHRLDWLVKTYDQGLIAMGDEFALSYVEDFLHFWHQSWGQEKMVAHIVQNLIKIFAAHPKIWSPFLCYVWYVLVNRLTGKVDQSPATILELSVEVHPNCSRLILELLKIKLKLAPSDAEMIRTFDSLVGDLKGVEGVEAWSLLVKSLTNDKLLEKTFTRAHMHIDGEISDTMRSRHLRMICMKSGLAKARALYSKLKNVPPFRPQFFVTMIDLELATESPSVYEIHKKFDDALLHFGAAQPALWLSCIQFEKKFCSSTRVGELICKAEAQLIPSQLERFSTLKHTLKELSEENVDIETNQLLVEDSSTCLTSDESEHDDLGLLGLDKVTEVSLFTEEPQLTYSVITARQKFFKGLRDIKIALENGKKNVVIYDGCDDSGWESVLKRMLGPSVSLSLRQVTTEDRRSEVSLPKGKKIVTRFSRKFTQSDQLHINNLPAEKSSDGEIEKLLSTSKVLQPEFMQQDKVEPYFMSKRKAKAIRKVEREKTKGDGWFGMKAPEVTEEVKRDLEVLQMRSVLDPKRHYKGNDMKVLPKYFQMGKVIDSPVEFYSSRITKKERKRTLADEIIKDEQVLRYQKRKYTEILAAKQKNQFRHPQKLHGGKKNREKSGKKDVKKRKVTHD